MYKRCIFILADGARPDVMKAELDAGRLPNISRYLVEPGTYKTILTSFPSTTGAAYLPFLTGCSPGTCNIPGIRWFDKPSYAKRGWSLRSFRSYVGLETYLMPHDIPKEIKTAFEIFDRPVSTFNMVNRGVDRGSNMTRFSRIWYMYYAHLTDRWSFVDHNSVKKLLAAFDTNPDFSFVVFPGIDEYSHRSSPFHPRTQQAYHELDSYVGMIVEDLKKRGWLEETLFMIAADHGLSETRNHFDVGPYLEEKGIKTFFYSQIFKRNFKAASMISGNGMANLYFEGKNGWGNRMLIEEMDQNLLSDLVSQQAIDVMVAQGANDSIHFLTKRGHGSFTVKGDRISYAWTGNEDPLGVFKTPTEMTWDESYKATFDSHYPDIFWQMYSLFKSPRCGDLVVSAQTGSDLRLRYEHPEHKASHGAICPEHMKIPFVSNHPFQLKERNVIRSVDVFPTLLELMGKKVPEGIDGRSFLK